MGHHSQTCLISGLPIPGGRKVRYLALAQNTYHTPNEWTCYVTGRWGLRTFPIEALYNDYGSIEEIKPGFISDLFFETLNYGTIERGLGDNSCHDVAVKRGMGRDEWLEALWEGRVVGRPVSLSLRLDTEDDGVPPSYKYAAHVVKIPKGVPTRKRIEKLIAKAGFHLSSGKYSDAEPGYVATYVRRGFVRVRYAGEFGKEVEGLAKLKPVIEKEYACMIIPGTGLYPDAAELIVTVDPSSSQEARSYCGRRGFALREKERLVPVAQGFVREDVWQTLLGMPFENWMYGKTLRYEDFLSAARTRVETTFKSLDRMKVLQKLIEKEPDGAQLRNELWDASSVLTDLSIDMQDPLSSLLGAGIGGPPGFNIRNAWQLALRKRPTGQDREDLAEAAAQTAFVECILSTVRYQWHVSGAGSQDPEPGYSERYLFAMAELAKKDREELERE